MELTENQINFLNRSIKRSFINWDMPLPHYKVNENGLVDIYGDFDCSRRFFEPTLEDLMGIRFGEVHGHFICEGHDLKSIEGMPRSIGKGRNDLNPCEFSISNNLIESIEGILPDQEAPIEYFSCTDNLLTSTYGIPTKVKIRYSDFNKNRLLNLRDLPFDRYEDLYLYDNTDYKSVGGVSVFVLKSIYKVMVESKCDFLTALTIRSKSIKYWHREDWDKMLKDPYIRNWVELTEDMNIDTIMDMSKSSLIVSQFEI